MEKEMSYDINVDFYKLSGKWYAGGSVTVHHYDFDDAFKQDIVDNQEILVDGWQRDNFIVVTDNLNEDDPFAKRFYEDGAFSDFHRGPKS